MSSTRILTAPARYIQGPGILSDTESYESLTGSSAFLLGGETALSSSESQIRRGLTNADIEIAGVASGVNECTFHAISEIADQVTAQEADIVIGIGGGVALDTSKGVAHETNTELVIVPTIASTDAPCSAIAVVYDESGAFAGYALRNRNPELVLADTRVIAESPTRFLRHGMGDAFATHFEAKTAMEAHATTVAGGNSSFGGELLAQACYTNLDTYGEDALAAVDNNAVTPAVERIVETNVVFSGIGFESGGLAAAHAFHKGFSSENVNAPHGLIVGFGAIAQLVLEGKSEELDAAIDVATKLGIAPSLETLGASPSQIPRIAERACEDDTTMSGEPMPVTPAMAEDALRTADQILRNHGN